MRASWTMRSWLWFVFLFPVIAGCGDDSDGQSDPAPDEGEPDAGVDGGGRDAGSAVPEVVAAFDPTAFELPEGLAVDGDQAYVGFAPTGAIVRVDIGSGSVAPYAQLPMPPPNQGFIAGLAPGPDGALYAALASFGPDVTPGIYQVGAGGGDAALFASHPDMRLPNGLAFDEDRVLWVTDSAAGAIFRIAPDGTTALAVSDERLRGQLDFCAPSPAGTTAFGANGIAAAAGVLYVANSDRASILRIELDDDGAADSISFLVEPRCADLDGADGLALSGDGSLIVASNRLDRLVSIAMDGSVRALFAGPPLDGPASVALVGAPGSPDAVLWITNFALASALAGREAHPALLRLDLSEVRTDALPLVRSGAPSSSGAPSRGGATSRSGD